MRKILCIYLICLPLFAVSQTKIALNAGINLATINFKDFKVEKRSITRLNAGLMINIPLEDNWSVYTGLHYSGKGVKHSRTLTTNKIDSFTIRLNYIELPVNIGYNFSAQDQNKFVMATGLYIGYGFNGNITTVNSSRPPKTHLHKKETNQYKRLETGFNLSTLYEINNKWGMRLDYSKSLLNIHRDKETKETNNVFGFSFFWYFKNKKKTVE